MGVILFLIIGPVFFALIQHSMTYGFHQAVIMALGILISDVLYVVISHFGFHWLSANPFVKTARGWGRKDFNRVWCGLFWEEKPSATQFRRDICKIYFQEKRAFERIELKRCQSLRIALLDFSGWIGKCKTGFIGF